jgi:tetratricopeptide (TPR) repeat protein
LTRYTLLFLVLAVLPVFGQDSPCTTGLNQVKSGDYGNGQASLWKCIESGASTETEAFYLTLTYRTLKNYDSGLEKAESALKNFPEKVDLLYIAAFLHYRRNEAKDSMILLSRAYKKNPNDWRIHQLFALNYIVFRMPDAVEIELNKAIALNPKNAELHYQLGRLYFSEEHFERSIEEVNRAVTIAPDYPEAYDSLGLSYEALQDFQKAGDNYRKAIDLDRKHGIKDEWPLVDYGTMLFREESPQAALPYFIEALEINPLSAKANYQAGRATRSLKRYDEAAQYFQKAIDVDPSYTYAYYQLATLVQQKGDEKRAAMLMDKYKTLSDSNTGTGTYNPSAVAHMAR